MFLATLFTSNTNKSTDQYSRWSIVFCARVESLSQHQLRVNFYLFPRQSISSSYLINILMNASCHALVSDISSVPCFKYFAEWYTYPIPFFSYSLLLLLSVDQYPPATGTGPTKKLSEACINVESDTPMRRQLTLLSTISIDVVSHPSSGCPDSRVDNLFRCILVRTAYYSIIISVCVCVSRLTDLFWAGAIIH